MSRRITFKHTAPTGISQLIGQTKLSPQSQKNSAKFGISDAKFTFEPVTGISDRTRRRISRIQIIHKIETTHKCIYNSTSSIKRKIELRKFIIHKIETTKKSNYYSTSIQHMLSMDLLKIRSAKSRISKGNKSP